MPAHSELAEWKSEAEQFVRDVKRRLNYILAELEGQSSGDVAVQPAASVARRERAVERPVVISAGDDENDRISALKAQLARNLHRLERAATTEPDSVNPGAAVSPGAATRQEGRP